MPDTQIFLIDAHALCYRSYFAIRNLANSKGQATNAVYGFLATLKKILRDHKPEYLAICFDAGKKTQRQEKFAKYKIHRRPMPDDLVSQIPLIKEVVAAYHWPVFEAEGFEADDIIATLAKKLSAKAEVVIVSDDKDMLQLLSDRVKVFSIRRDQFLNPKELKQELGIDPSRIVDYIGLAGDQTDNIPGVVGIGEVTAKELINDYGTLENIFQHLSQIKQKKVQEKLSEQKDMAFFSKELALLDSKVPVDIDLKEMSVREPDEKRLLELFRDLEFKKFADELSVADQEALPIKVKGIHRADDQTELVNKIKKAGRLVFMVDAPAEPTLTGAGIMVAVQEGEVYSISFELLDELKSVFCDPDILKITYDAKKVFKVFAEKQCAIDAKVFDVMLSGYLLAPSQTSFSVDTLSWIYLRSPIATVDRLARETECLLRLYPILEKELKAKDLWRLYEDIEIPLSQVLDRMEREGVRLDEGLLKGLSKDAERKINLLIEEIYQKAGREFNLNSPKQLAQVLFNELKFPVIKKTKTGFSTDEDVLLRLSKTHEIPAKILEYRQLAKLKSTYIDALPRLINPETGRLHARFNQTGTETGRLSSSDPNLQNIPIRTQIGRQIRKAFIPFQKNHRIVSADYSQIELRILAHLSGDKTLKKAFWDDQDIHNYTAALIYEVKEKDVTPPMRNMAKRVNFGLSYGMSPFGLSKDLDIAQSEAQAFIEKYFLRYPNVKKFMEDAVRKAEEQGFVLTLLNRRRYIPEILSSNQAVRQLAQRQAINTPVQGSAADLMKLAMIHIQRELEKKKFVTKMIITVHDELVFDVPDSEKKTIVELVRQKMEGAISLSVPIKVTVKSGPNWLELKEIKP